MKIVATTSLPVVNRPNADRWNAARSRQLVWEGRGGQHFSDKSEIQKSLKYPLGGGLKPNSDIVPKFDKS